MTTTMNKSKLRGDLDGGSGSIVITAGSEGRGQRAEGRGQRAEGRQQTADSRLGLGLGLGLGPGPGLRLGLRLGLRHQKSGEASLPRR